MVYNATLKVTLPYLVRCVHCQNEYVYDRVFTGKGSAESNIFTSEATAKRNAEHAANDHIERLLGDRNGFDAVPCRNCLQYQPYMFERVARSQFSSVANAGNAVIVLGFVAFLAGGLAWLALPKDKYWGVIISVAGIITILLGMGLLGKRARLIAEYNPNKHKQNERKRLANSRAKLREDYEETQAIRIRDIYKNYQATKASQRWRGNSEEQPEPLIVTWWATPKLFITGGVVTIDLAENASVAIAIPPNSEPGTAFDVEPDSATIERFQIRVLLYTMHPAEFGSQ